MTDFGRSSHNRASDFSAVSREHCAGFQIAETRSEFPSDGSPRPAQRSHRACTRCKIEWRRLRGCERRNANFAWPAREQIHSTEFEPNALDRRDLRAGFVWAQSRSQVVALVTLQHDENSLLLTASGTFSRSASRGRHRSFLEFACCTRWRRGQASPMNKKSRNSSSEDAPHAGQAYRRIHFHVVRAERDLHVARSNQVERPPPHSSLNLFSARAGLPMKATKRRQAVAASGELNKVGLVGSQFAERRNFVIVSVSPAERLARTRMWCMTMSQSASLY